MEAGEDGIWARSRALQSGAVPAGASIGIDLGTTNSCVSVWVEAKQRAKTIKDEATGRKTVKSAVWYAGQQFTAMGERALELSRETPPPDGTLIMSTKRFIGRRFSQLSERELEASSYGVFESDTKRDQILVGPRKREGLFRARGETPEAVATALLVYLKAQAERYLGKPATSAVVTVPAFFNEAQRAATRAAAEAAGLHVLRLLSEPMAAAMSYGLFVAGSKKVAILDMGGGTFDVSLLTIADGRFEALAIGGDNALGGDDVDQLLVEHVCKEIGQDLAALSPGERARLRADCEAAKIKLSTMPDAWATDTVNVTREALEALVEPLAVRMRKVIRGALADAGLDRDAVDEVVLVGLSTEMPWVRALARAEFGREELCTSVPADRAVSQGAAIMAAIMAGADTYVLSKVLMLDALPYSLGVETGDGAFSPVLLRNAKIPCAASKEFTTHSDFQRAITVDVFEGEGELARDNRWVDCLDFEVENGSRLRQGEAVVVVTFTIDADGTLSVSAETKRSEHASAERPEEGPNLTLLSLVVAFLAVLFVALRVVVEPLPIEDE